MRPLLVSVVVTGIGAMYYICFMLVSMVGGIAIMVAGMRVGTLMGMRMRSAICMGVLMDDAFLGVLVVVLGLVVWGVINVIKGTRASKQVTA